VARPLSDREQFRQRVDRSVLVLYASVVESLGWATAALLDQDSDLADRVISDDHKVDDRCRELTDLVKDRLSEATVEPDELEDLIAVLQMVPELERSADLAEHIAQRGRQGLGGFISPRSRGLVQSMCDVGIRMWQLSSRAYAERSRDLSFEINEADDELDNLSANLLREGAAGGVEPQVAAEVALIARFYERLGDHAVNLARRSAALGAPRRMSLRHRKGGSPRRRGAPSAKAPRFAWLRRRRPAPADGAFVELFLRAAANARRCAEELLEMVTSFSDLESRYQEIRTLERTGDELTVEVLRRLEAASGTPYEREDIHALAEELDDVTDDIFSAAELIHLVPLDCQLPEVREQAETLATMGAELESLIGCLASAHGAKQRLERIEELERQGDAIYRRTVARLFGGEFEALQVLKWKDIVEALENAMNRIEDVSDVVESILVKAG